MLDDMRVVRTARGKKNFLIAFIHHGHAQFCHLLLCDGRHVEWPERSFHTQNCWLINLQMQVRGIDVDHRLEKLIDG